MAESLARALDAALTVKSRLGMPYAQTSDPGARGEPRDAYGAIIPVKFRHEFSDRQIYALYDMCVVYVNALHNTDPNLRKVRLPNSRQEMTWQDIVALMAYDSSLATKSIDNKFVFSRREVDEYIRKQSEISLAIEDVDEDGSTVVTVVPRERGQPITAPPPTLAIPPRRQRFFFVPPHEVRGMIERGDVDEMRRALLERGLDPNMPLAHPTDTAIIPSETLLTLSVKLSKHGIAQLLLERGADPDKIVDSGPRFGTVIALSYISDVRMGNLLLEFGANLNHMNVDTNPLLFYIFSNVSMSDTIIRWAIQKGARINDNGRRTNMTPLGATVAHGSMDTIKILLDNGADPNQPTEHNGTKTFPLHLAAKRGSDLIAQLILDFGANIDAKDDNGDTALMVSIRSHTYSNYVAKLLIERGANVNIPNNRSQTPYTPYMFNGLSLELQQLLLDARSRASS